MKLTKNHDGYLQTILYKDGKRKTFRVHVLVAQAFLSNEENKSQVNHKWGIKTDNRASELEWNTQSENQQHAWRTGLQRVTEKRMVHARDMVKALSKKINQYDLQGNYIKTWECMSEASRKLSINIKGICFCCKGKRKTAGRIHMEIRRHSIGCLFCIERGWLLLARNKTKGIFQGHL